LSNRIGKEPTLSELETATGFSREEIAAALEATRPISSFQEIVHEEEGDAISREQLVGEETAHSKWLEQFALQEVIGKLPERLQRLVKLRFFEEKTQSEIAANFGVSQVQVCRLEKEALHRLRNLFLNE
jgi:RNA polymerase sporulation-specific sigma factor